VKRDTRAGRIASGIVECAWQVRKERLKTDGIARIAVGLSESPCGPARKCKSLDNPLRTNDNYEIFCGAYLDLRRIRRDLGQSR
jgi:hypothetical protein